jgi:hypothetical protein
MAPAAVHVRDSKNTHGPRLTLTPDAWAGFVTRSGVCGSCASTPLFLPAVEQ